MLKFWLTSGRFMTFHIEGHSNRYTHGSFIKNNKFLKINLQQAQHPEFEKHPHIRAHIRWIGKCRQNLSFWKDRLDHIRSMECGKIKFWDIEA